MKLRLIRAALSLHVTTSPCVLLLACYTVSLWFGCFLLFAPMSRAAPAADPLPAAGLMIDEAIGFRETIKIGKWLPVTISVRNDGPPVRGLLTLQLSTVSEGHPQPYLTTLSQSVDLPTHSRKRFTFVVMFRDFTTPLVVRLASQDGMVMYTRAIDLRTLTSPDRLILVLSDEPALDSLAGVAPGKARVVYLSLDELPLRWDALDAVDVIAFRNLSPAALKPDHLQALRQWIARGGRFLVTAGPNWVHYTHPALRELVPVKVEGLVEITTLAPLEALAGVPSPDEVKVPILRTEVLSGTILAATEEHALVIRQERGRGEVVFVTFDPGRAPLVGWDGTPELWRTLFRLDETPNYWRLRRELRETFEETWIAQILQLPLLSFPSHLLLAVFLILYAGTIGFFFWRAGLESIAARETWVFIVLSLAAFSAAGHLLFREQHIQQDALLFEVSAVDAIPESRFAEIETHLALLSTRKQSYNIRLAGQPSVWLQIVPPAVRALPLDWRLHQNNALTIQDTLVPAWGLRVFKGKGMTELPLETRVLQEADSVMVRVANNSGLMLSNCWLWRGPRIVALGDLADGETVEGVLTVSPEEMARGVQQARWERDLAHEMFKGRTVPDLLGRLMIERSIQEVLRSDLTWQHQVMFVGWLEQPLVTVSVQPGDIASRRATLVRLRLPLQQNH
jgi:hypothetical protein